MATLNPVQEDLDAVLTPTPTYTKTTSPDTVPLEWADEILCLDSDEEESHDHWVAEDKIILWKLSLNLNLQLL